MNDWFELLFCPQHGILVKVMPFFGVALPAIVEKYHQFKSFLNRRKRYVLPR